jgi:hypothetical protein
MIGFNQAKAAILAGTAEKRALWVLLQCESERDGYALRPRPWEGAGQYQAVTFGDGRCVFVLIPSGHRLPGECAGFKRKQASAA